MTHQRFFRPLPRSLSSFFSSLSCRKIAQIVAITAAASTTSLQSAYAINASSASICDPFDPQVVGYQLAKLMALETAITFLVFLLALLVRDLIWGWIDRRAARGAK